LLVRRKTLQTASGKPRPVAIHSRGHGLFLMRKPYKILMLSQKKLEGWRRQQNLTGESTGIILYIPPHASGFPAPRRRIISVKETSFDETL